MTGLLLIEEAAWEGAIVAAKIASRTSSIATFTLLIFQKKHDQHRASVSLFLRPLTSVNFEPIHKSERGGGRKMANSERIRESKRKLDALRKCAVELSSSMNPEDMKAALYSRKMLTQSEMEELGISRSTKDKNLSILLKIPRKGLDAFDHFMDALQETSTENPAHKELIDLLLVTLNNSNTS